MPGKAIFSQSTLLPSRVIQALRKKNRGMRRSRRQGFVSSLRIGLPETKKQGRRVATVAPAATYSEVVAASKEQENCNTCYTPPSSSHHQLRNTVTAIHHVSQHNTPRLNQSSDFKMKKGGEGEGAPMTLVWWISQRQRHHLLQHSTWKWRRHQRCKEGVCMM